MSYANKDTLEVYMHMRKLLKFISKLANFRSSYANEETSETHMQINKHQKLYANEET